MKSQKPKQKNKLFFSILNIVFGVLIISALMTGLAAMDNYLMGASYYQDLWAEWTPQGDKIIYVRWILNNSGKTDSFQILLTDPEGKKHAMVYESEPLFNIYSIRKFGFSSDGKSIQLRTNHYKNNNIIDTLYNIPLDGSLVKSWQLDKVYPYDVFLDFKDDLAVVRRMKAEGKNAPSELQVCRFSDTEILRSYDFSNGETICIYAGLYGEYKSLAGIVRHTRDVEPDEWKNKIVFFDINKTMFFPMFMTHLHCLEEPDRYLSVDFTPKHDIYLLNPITCEAKKITNPASHKNSSLYSIAKDKKSVYLAGNSSIINVDLTDNSTQKFSIDADIVSPPFEDGNGRLIFSDGNSILVFDKENNSLTNVTEPSPRSKLMKDKRYIAYLRFRSSILKHFTAQDQAH